MVTGEVVRLRGRVLTPGGLKARLRRVSTILGVIEAGELLAALPMCPIARSNHLAALDLIAILEDEVAAACQELED